MAYSSSQRSKRHTGGRKFAADYTRTPRVSHRSKQKIRAAGVEPVGADETVRFDKPGVERFQTDEGTGFFGPLRE